jgi:hypothetical protein
MRAPDILVYKNPLIFPPGEDDRVIAEIVRQSNPLIAQIAASTILRSHFPAHPIWAPDADGVTGVLQVKDSFSGEIIPTATVLGTEIITPYSTDGLRIHEGQRVIMNYGNVAGSNMEAWWGVATFDLNADATEPITTWNVHVGKLS